jgi:pSer/pThr/pTyr-binding forkhead associated (FHA) protein
MKLIIEDGEGRRSVVPLAGDEITIGRNQENVVRLVEKNVSRRHGRLFREGGRFYIEDLRSLTGIRVNGEKVKGPRPVEQGDRIRISEYDLTLEPETGEKPAIPPAEQPAAPSVEVPSAMRARLVGISGTYRGATLVLDRSPLRIGSSGENEIVIHHPSISRRHLRLHLVDGGWKVMDVEARNAVRVNGEARTAIALRHGDVIEIGYLRFAFADAGRELELPREFAPMPVKAQGRRGGSMPVKAIVGLLAILLAGALLLRQPADDDDLAVMQDSKPERAAALRSAQDAIQGHRYVEARQKLEAARRAGASAAELKDADSVEAEARAENLFRDLQSALAAKDWERARDLGSSLGSSRTWYGAQAAPLAQAATMAYVARHVAAAAALKGNDDAACVAEARLALDADATSPEAAQLAQACSAPAVRTDALAAPAAHFVRGARSGTDSEARKLIGDGNRKLAAQDLPGAIALYEKALVLKPARPVLATAYRGMGAAFTRQGNIEEGAHYYKLYLPLCSDPAEKARVQKLLDDYDARRR